MIYTHYESLIIGSNQMVHKSTILHSVESTHTQDSFVEYLKKVCFFLKHEEVNFISRLRSSKLEQTTKFL